MNKETCKKLLNTCATLQYNLTQVEQLQRRIKQIPDDKRAIERLEKTKQRVEKYKQLIYELIQKPQQDTTLNKISTTERQMFKRCRRMWDFSSHNRQNLEPLRPNTKLWFGAGIHRALEAYYGEQRDPVTFWEQWTLQEFERMQQQGVMFQEEEEQFLEHRQLGIGMLEHYVRFSQAYDDFEVITTEQRFEVPIRSLTGQIVGMLTGRFDGICRTSDGKLWLLEHKTASDKWSTELMMYDDQVTGYLWAAQQVYGQPLEGVYFNILRKKVPRKPPLVRNGKQLSKSKDIDTTYEVYMQTIEEYGLDAADYEDILAVLEAKGNTFFQREKVYKSQEQIRRWGEMLYHEYLDMTDNPRIYANKTRDCRWDCGYQVLCEAIDDGSDIEFLKQTMYRTRERR